MTRWWLRAVLAALSAGWLLPMWLGVQAVLDVLRSETWLTSRDPMPLDSFPHLSFAADCFALAFAWLGLVVVVWAWVALGPSRDARP